MQSHLLAATYIVASFVYSSSHAADVIHGELNVSFREKRCKSGQEKGLNPIWHESTFSHNGKSWERRFVCELSLMGGKQIFHDGCTGQAPGKSPNGDGDDAKPYGVLFHEACVTHDHCYHHNPASYGLSKSDCENNFERDMKKICEDTYSTRLDTGICKRAADVMKAAVIVGGGENYRWYNTYTDYENPVLYDTGWYDVIDQLLLK